LTKNFSFYEVQKGKILCNGSNIAELNIREYRKMISLVAQEPTLFQGTIKVTNPLFLLYSDLLASPGGKMFHALGPLPALSSLNKFVADFY
jgi:ABC-type multidrug transport system fused ATPase/permease subunit